MQYPEREYRQTHLIGSENLRFVPHLDSRARKRLLGPVKESEWWRSMERGRGRPN